MRNVTGGRRAGRARALAAAGILAAALSLAASDGAAAARRCGTIHTAAANLPVVIVRGRVSCATARRAVRQFFPARGRARQLFRLARRTWFCANAHGRELERGGVAHCLSGRISVAVRQPPPPPGSSRSKPVRLGSGAMVGDWRISVLGINVDATREIVDSSEYSDPPAAGMRFVTVALRGGYVGRGSSTFIDQWRVVGRSAVAYEDGCQYSWIPDAIPDNEVFRGGEVEGKLCFEVPDSDAGSLVLYGWGDYFDDTTRVFFSLGGRDPGNRPA